MIALDILRQTGNVEALINLVDEDDSLTVDDLSDVMGLHESTVRQRMSNLEDAGLVTTEAEIINDQAVRVWIPTPDGEAVASSLTELVSDYEAGQPSPRSETTAETETTEADD